MIKKEFEEYIEKFHKNPGDFSDDEIYDIGVQHKTLPRGEKNWKALAQRLGWTKSAEALRQFVIYRSQKDGTLPKNVRELSGRTIKDVDPEIIDANINKQIENLYVEKIKTRDWYNAYRRTLRDEARIEELKTCITDSVSLLNALPQVIPVVSNTTEDEAILMISDLHLGVDCDNFYNTYNLEVAQQRLNRLVRQTIDYCHKHNVQKLNILNLGDMIHGIIHTSARIDQEIDATEQVMKASELIAEVVNKLQAAAPVIIYRSVVDNHSRVMPNKSEHIEKENFARIMQWFIEERLKDTKVIFQHDNLDAGLGIFDLDNKQTVAFAHGHEDQPNKSMQNMVGASRQFVDYVLLSHYHSPRQKEYQGCTVIVNGSIVGTEQYALSKRLFALPSQKLLIFHGADLVDIDIRL